jgi:hypothetical protein
VNYPVDEPEKNDAVLYASAETRSTFSFFCSVIIISLRKKFVKKCGYETIIILIKKERRTFSLEKKQKRFCVSFFTLRTSC